MIQGPIEILVNDSTVAGLIGNNKANTKVKVYWVVCPDTETFPYVILALQSNSPTQHKGPSSSLDMVRFNTYIYGIAPEVVDEIDIAIRAALEQNNVTAGGFLFHRISFTGQGDGYDKEAKLPYRVSEYEAMVQRTIPT